MTKFDERDSMFARLSYQPGSWQYEEYYGRNPHKQKGDDELRKDLNLFGAGGKYHHPLDSVLCDTAFGFLADIKDLAEGVPQAERLAVDKEAASEKVKEIAALYGACATGITLMTDEMYYSHRGRRPEVYGQPVDTGLRYGIVFAVEMDGNLMKEAPGIGESVAVTHGYVKAAVVGMMLAYFLRGLGYQARNHMDGNYLVIAARAAVGAGLGQIGRHGLLLHPQYGSRLRLGVVTTDLELLPAATAAEPYREYCKLCGVCAAKCPGQALSYQDKYEHWRVDDEKCFKIWKEYGTDCGLCVAACPISRKR